MSLFRKFLPALILTLAFALRAWQLTAVPPGLTHDEAGHGHDATHILKGITPIYFTVGYGREPLFDYFNAGLIAMLGANPFTLRFSAVIWGMIALAATYRVARLCFDRNTALIALALMAFSFWPLATSRQILRSGMLPGEMAIAVLLFLQMTRKEIRDWRLEIGLGLAIAASLYTYIPARALWLMFPLAIITHYVSRISYPVSRNTGYGIRITDYRLLLPFPLAFLLAAPLFLYLYQHPEAEQRIGMLAEPLTALQNGDPTLILNNTRETLLAFFLPGHGDHFLAYTLPGRPLFDPITTLLAFLGFGLLIIRWSLPDHAPLFLFWLLLGLAPALITGPEALTTRLIGAQPVLYILPALGLSKITHYLFGLRIISRSTIAITSLFIASLFIASFKDYFFTWAKSPDVRAAYQSTLIAMLKTINGPAVISTLYPSAPHDPYIGELLTHHETRWVDGRFAMLIPAAPDFQLVAPASTPLHPAFNELTIPIQTFTLLAADLDPSFTQLRFAHSEAPSPPTVVSTFNNAIRLVSYYWTNDAYQPGEIAEFFTLWRILDPVRLGPLQPPALKTELNLFTHLLNPDGSIFLQQDRLDAPSWDWQTGDLIIQIHQFAIPADAAPGNYPVEIGLYDRPTGERLLTDTGADYVTVAPLIIR